MSENKRTENIYSVLIFILVIISVFFLAKMSNEYGSGLFGHGAVSIFTLIPLMISLILFGLLLRILKVSDVQTKVMIFFPIVHVTVELFAYFLAFATHSSFFAILFILASVLLFRCTVELISIGYLIACLIRYKDIYSNEKMMLMVFSILVSVGAVGFSVKDMLYSYIAGF